jgi:hypothetical protein
MVSIDLRRALLEEVETKASAIVNLLDDVRINVETIGNGKPSRTPRSGLDYPTNANRAGGATVRFPRNG